MGNPPCGRVFKCFRFRVQVFPVLPFKSAGIRNLVSQSYAETFYELGKRSGRDEDKMANLRVKTQDGLKVAAPILVDCPVNIECSVMDSILAGSHEMFVGRIEYVHADQSLLLDDGAIDFSKLDLL